jgi:MerR family copper efflux transcriptional regulator
MESKKLLQIGEVASEAGVNIQTIRYYERMNILKPATRKESGFRLYEPDTVQNIRFIKHAQELGFTLKEIKELLTLRATTMGRCLRVKDKAEEKLVSIQDKLKLLKQMEKNLKKLINDCDSKKTSATCPILDGMDKF